MINYACHQHIIYRKYTISSYDDCYQWRKRWVISNSKTQIVLKDLGCCFGASDTSFSPTSIPKIGSPWSAWWEHVCDQNCKCTAASFAGKLSALHVKIKLLLVSSKQLQDMQSVAIWVLGALHPIHFKPCRLIPFCATSSEEKAGFELSQSKSWVPRSFYSMWWLHVCRYSDSNVFAFVPTFPHVPILPNTPWSSTVIHCPSRSLPGRGFLMPIFGWNLIWMCLTRSWCSCCWSSIEHVTSQILTKPVLQVSRFKQKTPFRIIISPILILKQQSSNRIICSVLVAK